jgi:hypothetical protein
MPTVAWKGLSQHEVTGLRIRKMGPWNENQLLVVSLGSLLTGTGEAL